MNKIDSDSPNFLQQYKTYYESCYDFDPLIDTLTASGSLRQHIYEIGKFYDVTHNVNKLENDLLVAKLLNSSFPTLFDIQLQVNRKNKLLTLAVMPTTHNTVIESLIGENYYSKECLLKYTIGKTFINEKTFNKYKECEMDFSSYLKTTKAALEYISAFSDTSKKEYYIEETLETLKKDILDKLKTGPTSSKLKESIELRDYELINVGKLKEIVPNVEWDDIFSDLLGYTNDKIKILGYFLNDLNRTTTEIFSIDSRRVNNALLAMYTHNLYRDLVLQRRQLQDKHLHCLKICGKLMSDVTSLLYLDSFDSINLAKIGKCPIKYINGLMDQMYSTVTSTLMADLESSDISIIKSDLKTAKEKINNLRLVTISKFPPWNDINFLDDRFTAINFTDDFIKNTELLLSRHSKLMYNSISNDPFIPESMWTYIALPYDTNIKIDLDLNILVIPLAAMEYLRKLREIPQYLLIADVTFKMAKEISFYLEASGIRLYEESEKIANDILDIHFTDPITKESIVLNLNSKSQVMERITDHVALQIAYTIYNKTDIEIKSKELPLPWLNRNIKDIFFLYTSQQFCSKRSTAEKIIDVCEESKLPSSLRLIGLIYSLKHSKDFKICLTNSTIV